MRVIVAFPPNRVSKEFKKACDAYIQIGAGKVRHAQLPDTVLAGRGSGAHLGMVTPRWSRASHPGAVGRMIVDREQDVLTRPLVPDVIRTVTGQP